MRYIAGAVVLALACAPATGMAEDAGKPPQTPWDIAYGGALMTDYNLRGISGSDHRPAATAYVEPRYEFSRSLEAYLNVTTNSIAFGNHAAAGNEILAGMRPTFDRLALDFGIWEHWLTGGQCFNLQGPGGLCIPQLTVPNVNSIPAHLSYWEVFGKAAYSVDRQLSFGGRVLWTPSIENSGAEATYTAGWVKYILPQVLPRGYGWYISAEAGHWFLGGSPYASFTNWNAGLAFTWKRFTLDLRYSGTDRHDCETPVTAIIHVSNRCGPTFIAKLSFDLTKKNATISGFADNFPKPPKADMQANADAKAADRQAQSGKSAKADRQAEAGKAAKSDQKSDNSKKSDKAQDGPEG